MDTGSTSLSSLSRVESNDNHADDSVPDPRGEAPGYFEVVGDGQVGSGVDRTSIDRRIPNTPASPVTPATAESTSPTTTSPPTSPQRRSGFRALLSRTPISRTFTHTRNGSTASGVSSNIHIPDSPSRTHARGGSTTSLVSALGLTRTRSFVSHNSSRANLASPSMISLNSISAPLTHTAIRTEFAAFPKQGLTPEQMRLISSREGLAKFGVPYGPDAKAFASMSAVDLLTGERPPEFSTVVGGENSNEAGASTSAPAEPSASTSNEAERATGPETGEEAANASSASPRQSSEPSSEGQELQTSTQDVSASTDLAVETGGEPEKDINVEIVAVIEEIVSLDKGKAKEVVVMEEMNSLEDNKSLSNAALPATTEVVSPPSQEPEPSPESATTFKNSRDTRFAIFAVTTVVPRPVSR
ncbi:hypothetical protein NP233_g12004 [Leucocoprinus birnbaumii]|uniref:Uncharacterized protein n=1 Tax=Leucocoprinus birnbaumii TaxID=56174 RepID=A0AAD5VFS0_9AGAR|nr:hypothetical protein NP233_g12004 [Leucocoprinus birnbaumii]